MCVCAHVCVHMYIYMYPRNTITQVVGSQVEILRDGQISFIGNDAEGREGGALFMQDFGQIKMHYHSSMDFINNTGR